LGENIKDIDMATPPPEIGSLVYSIVNEVSGETDPYYDIKQKHIKLALSLYPRLLDYVNVSANKLDMALRISSAGNIIDLGAQSEIRNIERVLHDAINMEHRIWHSDILSEKLPAANSVLIIGDNAGETVFDKVLSSVIRNIYPEMKIYYAVRESPIINDATREDAYKSGIDEFAEIISTGCSAPGILFTQISKLFANLFEKCDIIISKGQGNYETLNDVDRDIFFLLTVKCEIVARHLNLPVGASVLYYSEVN